MDLFLFFSLSLLRWLFQATVTTELKISLKQTTELKIVFLIYIGGIENRFASCGEFMHSRVQN